METNNNQLTDFKLVLCGDDCVGKTTYITKLSGKFEKKYVPGIGKTNLLKLLMGEFEKKNIATLCEVYPLLFYINNNKKVQFNVWDTTGQEKFGSCIDAYNTDCVIIMFDLTNSRTFKKIDYWYNIAKKYTNNIVLCGNKTDIKFRKIKPKQIKQYIENKNIKYYNISAISNFNIELPFLYLTQQLLGDNNLEFVNRPTINAPTI